MHKLIFTLFLILPTLLQAQVTLSDKTIIYSGQINKQNNNTAAELLKTNPTINTFTITSGGGNIDLGMDLAELILAHKLTVNIKQFCFSSCANYVLLAGHPTTIEPNTIIGWHGDAASAKWLDSDIDAMVKHLKEPQKSQKWQTLRAHYDEVIAKASLREKAFYTKLNVNHDLLTVGLKPSLRSAAIKQLARGWTYSPKVLNYFGISNISYNNWQPRSAKNFPLLIISDLN
ncbi:hypothetical protein [Pseudoalteromonas agarivorans]|nr:hypothetical protein [Pseudoalteromonas agarivorans]